MKPITISLITVCYNAGSTLERCIRSVIAQQAVNLEYVLIDGASTDASLNILKKYRTSIAVFRSEKDSGPYAAMNKGIALAGGDIIGFLHADDQLANPFILKIIAEHFQTHPETDAVFGDLNFFNAEGKPVRRWRSSVFTPQNMRYGWMPAHPTFYVRRKIYDQLGVFNAAFGSAADYELMLRFLYRHRIKADYLPVEMVNMQTGGISNRSYANRLKASKQDAAALKKHGIRFPYFTVFLKIFRKINQLKIV